MQILLLSVQNCIALLYGSSLPTLQPYPALVIVIPNVIRLKVETAVPRKCALSVLNSMDPHERAGGEMVRGEGCINPSLDILLVFKNLSRCEAC